jgi:WD40 repeat protein
MLSTTLTCEWDYTLTDAITGIAVEPSGDRWAVCSAAGELVTIDRDFQLQQIIPTNDRPFYGLAFSGDGKYLAAGGETGVVVVGEDRIDRLPQSKWVEHLAWHPVVPQLAYSYGSKVEIWHPQLGVEMSIDFARSSVLDLAWHPHGTHLAIAGYKGVTIRSIVDLTATPIEIPVDTAASHIAWSPDGRYLAAACFDRSIYILDLSIDPDPWLLRGCERKIRDLLWAEAEGMILAVASGNDIVCWQSDANLDWTGSIWSGHELPIHTLALHPSGEIITSTGEDGMICLRTLAGDLIDAIDSGAPNLDCWQWHPQGTSAIVGYRSGQLSFWIG